MQYIADNVDHNLRTIDGHNTFHGMGMMATITPGKPRSSTVSRVEVTNEDIYTIGRVNISHFISGAQDVCLLQYKALQEHEKPCLRKVDLLWDISLCITSQRPA